MKNLICLALDFESNTQFIFKGGIEDAWEKQQKEFTTIKHKGEKVEIDRLASAPELIDLSDGKKSKEIKQLQTILDYLGFNSGKIDSTSGPKTRSALLAFKKKFNTSKLSEINVLNISSKKADWKLVEDGNFLDTETIWALEAYTIWQQTHTELTGHRETIERSRLQEELIGRNWREMMNKYPFTRTWKGNKRAEIFTSKLAKKGERFTGKEEQNKRLYDYLTSLPVEQLAELLRKTEVSQALENQHTERAQTAIDHSQEIVRKSADKKLNEFMRVLYSENVLYEVAQKAVDGEGNIQLAGWIEAISDFFQDKDKPDYTEEFIRKALEEKIDQAKFQIQRANILKAMEDLGIKTEHNKPWFKELLGLVFLGFLTLAYWRSNITINLKKTVNRDMASQLVNWIGTGAMEPFDTEKAKRGEYGPTFTGAFEKSRAEHEELMARTGVVQRYGDEISFLAQQDVLRLSRRQKVEVIKQFMDQYGKSAFEAGDELFSWWEAYFTKDSKKWENFKEKITTIRDESKPIDDRYVAIQKAQAMIKKERADDEREQRESVENDQVNFYKKNIDHTPLTLPGGKTVYVFWDDEMEKFEYHTGNGRITPSYMPFGKMEPFFRIFESDAAENRKNPNNWRNIVVRYRQQLDNKDKLIQAPEAFHGYTTEFKKQINALCEKIHQLSGNIDTNRLAGVLDQFPTWKDVFVRYPAPSGVQKNLSTLFYTCATQDIDSPQEVKNKDLQKLLNADGIQEWLTAVLSPETYEAYHRENVARKMGTLRSIRRLTLQQVQIENPSYGHGKKVTKETPFDNLLSESPDGKKSTAEYILGSIAESYQDFPLYLTPEELEVAFKNRTSVSVDTLPQYVRNRSRQVRDQERMKTLPAKDKEIFKMTHEKKYEIIGDDGVRREITINYDLYLRPDCANVVTVPGSISFGSRKIPLDPLNLPTDEYLQEHLKLPLGFQVWGGLIGRLMNGGGKNSSVGNKGTQNEINNGFTPPTKAGGGGFTAPSGGSIPRFD